MLLPVILFVVWIVILIALKRLKLHFFVFIIGCVGLFCFLMFLGRSTAEQYLEYALTYCMRFVGKITGLFDAYSEYSLISVHYKHEAVSFFVDYECSGFIEILVYVCLLLFYPIYRFKGKVFLSLAGGLYIFVCNIIRVFVICLIVKLFGPNLFYLSHTIFARILFFGLTVCLYYVVFTRPHIINQKVGNMTYDVR